MATTTLTRLQCFIVFNFHWYQPFTKINDTYKTLLTIAKCPSPTKINTSLKVYWD